MKKERQFRIVKYDDYWILQELIEWKWWIFSTKSFVRIATSHIGPEPLKEYVNNLLQPDGVVWESTKTLTENQK